DRRLRVELDNRRQLRRLLRISLTVPSVVIGLIPVAAALAGTGPLLRAYVELIAPFLLAAAVLAVRYGNSLRRAVKARLPTARTRRLDQRHRLISSLLSWFLVVLLLFAGVDGFAKVVGRGLAR